MTTKREYQESAIYLWSGLQQAGESGRRYWLGAIPTVHGLVAIYAEDRYATWKFIHEGREHRLVERRTLTSRGLVRIGRRFAADVVNGRQP